MSQLPTERRSEEETEVVSEGDQVTRQTEIKVMRKKGLTLTNGQPHALLQTDKNTYMDEFTVTGVLQTKLSITKH